MSRKSFSFFEKFKNLKKFKKNLALLRKL